MRRTISTLTVIVAVSLASASASAQTSYPMLNRIEPTAAQRGQSIEVAIGGDGNVSGATQLLFGTPLVRGEILDSGKGDAPKEKGRRRRGPDIHARLTVAPDAPLGPCEIRLVTPRGVSSVGLVVIVDDPVVPEADDAANDQAGGAQRITLPAVVSGAIGKLEDVDWYRFHAEAEQWITFSVWANRLEDKIHDLQAHFDPILAIHDASGREIAVDDNHDFADPRFSFQFKEAGDYALQIRDTSYAGNRNWTYVLQVSGGPAATSVFPMAVNPASKAVLSGRGVNFDVARPITVDVPAGVTTGAHPFALSTAQGATLAFPLVVTTFPLVTEVGDAPAAATPETQMIAFPAALSGRLGEPNDIDGYRIEVKKGKSYRFDVVARRAGLATDPLLRVLDAKGATLAEADDGPGSKDPTLEWVAPADGSFVLQVSDLHSRGGEEFGYVLQVEEAAPDFTLTCDPDKINLGPGGRVPMFVRVVRRAGFNGPVTLRWDGLPPGVSTSPLTIPSNMTQGVSVVSASPEAKPSASLMSLSGVAETPSGPIVRKLEPTQEIYIPGGGRGILAVETAAVAVTTPSDIRVDAKPTDLVLQPGGTATIDVTVTRQAGYDKGVNLALAFQHLGQVYADPLPPGVTVKESASKTLLGPAETSGKIVLEVKPDAPPCDKVPIAVMGHVSINFVVKTSYASAPIYLTIPAKTAK